MKRLPRLVERARRYDRLLARHGYLVERAPEVLVMNPVRHAQRLGGHARWMCNELIDGDVWHPVKAMRWLSFVKGILWCLGVLTLEELIERFDSEEWEEA